ncbi:MAG: hypothetical protein OEV44_12655, partial [Spirochaetota bacterium]|nr:hypothetical protein [Spirochaetota bacterium]
NIIFQYKKTEVFRIGINELIGVNDLISTEKELTNLADACIETVFEIEKKRFESKYKQIEDCKYAIFAQEQYGTKELSYNSPLKLIFIYDDEGKTNISRHLSSIEYYSLLSQNFIQAVQPTNNEILYKLVYSKKSSRNHIPIVYSVENYIRHIENKGSILDRLQLIKIRFCVGDRNLGKRFIKTVNPLTYRKYYSLTDFSESKHLINRAFNLLGSDNLKVIDVIVRLLQLFNAGKDRSIQKKHILNVITSLMSAKIISFDEKNIIENAYIFLKQLIHKADLFEGVELSNILNHDELSKSLSKSMNYVTHNEFLKHYQQIVLNIKKILQNHFQELIDKSEMLDFLSLLNHDPQEAVYYLSQLKIDNSINITNVLKDISPASQIGKESFAKIIPILFDEVKVLSDRDTILINLSKTVQSYKIKDSLFELLAHNENLVRTLAKLFISSQFLTDILIQYPELLEKISEPSFFEKRNSIKRLTKYLQRILKIKPFSEAIFIFKNYETFRIGLRYILGFSDIILTTSELSNLAEVILFESFKYFYKNLLLEKPNPTTEVAIILLGKLGGRELNFGSDLDIFFVYEKEEEIALNYNNSHFYSDLVSKLSHFLSYPGPYGNLYEIDLKLRPEGRNAPMILSVKKFQDYLNKKAGIWEKLVYTKANILSTSHKFKCDLKEIIFQFIYSIIDPKHLKNEIIIMRKKILDNAVKKHNGFLFKKGEGGTLDLEFLVEYLNIIYGRSNPRLRKRNIYNMLQSLYREGILSKKKYNTAKSSIFFLRKIETNLRIMSNFSHEKIPNSNDDLDNLVLKLGFSDRESFLNEYKKITYQVRELYNKFLL